MGLAKDGEQPVVDNGPKTNGYEQAECSSGAPSTPAGEAGREDRDKAAEAVVDTVNQPEITLVFLKEQLAAKTAEAEDYFGRLQRMQADFDNFRKRWRREQEDMLRYAAERMVLALLPIMDDFERALSAIKQTGETPTFIEGGEMIVRQLQGVLEQEGVQPIKAVGEPFDPFYHEAVMRVDTTDYETGIIVEEFRKGYQLGEKVIRPAMVKVAQNISESGN